MNNIYSILRHNRYIISHILIICVVVFCVRNTIYRGFDFTDATLNYHFSIQILEGEIPFVDFFSAVMPAAYYIEALFHSVLGYSYSVNKILGVATLIVLYFSYYKILSRFFGNTKSIFFVFLVSSILSLGSPVYFNFTPFVGAVSVLFTAALTSKREINESEVLIYGILSGLIFATKQSYMIGVVPLIITVATFKWDEVDSRIKEGLRYAISFLATSLIFVLPSIFHGGLDNIIYTLTTGSKKKGLTSVWDFITTAHGLPNVDMILFSLFIIISVAIVYLYCPGDQYIFAIPLILAYLNTAQAANLRFLPLYGYYEGMITNILYDVPRILSILYLIYAIYGRRLNYNLTLISVSVLGFTTAAQLGWPGRPYLRPALSSYCAFLTPLLIKPVLRGLRSPVGPSLSIDYAKNLIKVIVYALICSVFVIDVIFPTWTNRRDFKATEKVTVEPYLNKWNISREHHSFIKSLEKTKITYCRKDETMFVFPWAPVLYTISGMENPTIQDLPYHDWITERQGKETYKKLRNKKPCMIVYGGSFESNKQSPFPARGMKLINNKIRDMIGNKYIKVSHKKVFMGKYKIFVEREKVKYR